MKKINDLFIFLFFSSCFYVGEKTDFLFEHKTTRIYFPHSSSSLFSNLLVSMFVFFLFTLSLSHDKSFTMHVFKKQKCLAACVFSLFSLASACGMIYILLYTYIYIYTFHIFCLIKNANFTEKKR